MIVGIVVHRHRQLLFSSSVEEVSSSFTTGRKPYFMIAVVDKSLVYNSKETKTFDKTHDYKTLSIKNKATKILLNFIKTKLWY